MKALYLTGLGMKSKLRVSSVIFKLGVSTSSGWGELQNSRTREKRTAEPQNIECRRVESLRSVFFIK